MSTSHPSEEPLPEQDLDAQADVRAADAAPDGAQTGQPANQQSPESPIGDAAESTTPSPQQDDHAAAPPPPPPPPGNATSGLGAVPPPVMGPGPGFTAAPQQPQVGVRYDVPQDQKNLALISTLGMLIAGFLSPLIVYVLTNGDPAKRFANDHAKEGLNFSIVFFVGMIVSGLLVLVLVGVLLIPLLMIWGIWVIIAGAIQASNGEAPHYPLVPKILK